MEFAERLEDQKTTVIAATANQMTRSTKNNNDVKVSKKTIMGQEETTDD